MSAARFPEEPIRDPGPRPGDWDFPAGGDPRDDDELADDEDRGCWTCDGEGFTECEEDDCFHAPPGHLVTCRNCRGSGDAADVWFW